MNLTNEQIQAILDGAPEGMNHIGVYQGDIVPMPNSCGDVHNLSDLREIIELRQEVERSKAAQSEVAARAVEALAKADGGSHE